MRIPRIFIDQALKEGETIKLDGQAFIHCHKVLRLKQGNAIILFNGKGSDWSCKISSVEKKFLFASIQQEERINKESGIEINLYQALSKREHMDFTIQKAMELGVTNIFPFYSQRSQGRLNQQQSEKKIYHWNNVIQSANEQNGRTLVPQISRILSYEELLQTITANSNFFLLHIHEKAIKFNQINNRNIPFNLICGPEGGFNEQEIEAFLAKKIEVLTLGPRVLRTETAGITAVTILQHRFGDIS